MASKPQAKKLARELLQHNHDVSQHYGLSRRDYLDLVETIIVYKFSQMTREEIRKMLDLPNIDLKDTRYYQSVFEEGENAGLRKGVPKGRREEREQNRLSEIALVKRLLDRTLGELPEEINQRLGNLSIDKAHLLVEALLDFRSVDDLQAWFQSNDKAVH